MYMCNLLISVLLLGPCYSSRSGNFYPASRVKNTFTLVIVVQNQVSGCSIVVGLQFGWYTGEAYMAVCNGNEKS